MKRWFSFVSGLGLFWLIILLVINTPILFQEGNPLPLLVGVKTIFFNSTPVVEISHSPTRYLIRSNSEGINGLIEFLQKKYGWQYSEQIGSVVFFEAGDEKTSGKLRMWTNQFMIFELNR